MMKHTLEKILEYGRTLFDVPPVDVNGNSVRLRVDNKVILMSTYTSKRVFELSGRQLEISFMYGGKVDRRSGETHITIDDFYIPCKQRISEGSFDGTVESTFDANQYFSRLNKRLVGIGHSHASYDVFHSATDLDNYKNLVGTIGVKIEHIDSKLALMPRIISSVSARLGKHILVHAPRVANSSFSYVLPSLIFNAKGEHIDSAIAAKSYAYTDGRVETSFALRDCDLIVYNKQAVLTADEKLMIDRAIRKVLAYNNLRVFAQA